MDKHQSALGSTLAAAALLVVAMLVGAAAPDTSDPGSLAGQLLIAAPTMSDPRFAHTVILMVRHDQTGAFGIVINRPVGERSIAVLLEAAGDIHPDVEGSVRVFAGGPVQTELGFVVHSADYHRGETVDVDGRVAMTASREILRDIGHNQGPAKSLFAFGYAGWGPGQLEGEMARHNWFTAPEEPKLIFDDDRDNLWEETMARRTREL
jgi:putative transcriptional regulator